MPLSAKAEEIIAQARAKSLSRANPSLAELPSWFNEYRPHQCKAVAEVMDAFTDGCPVVVLDAPTGSGKTLIAETVRRLLRIRALYVCSTKTLQDQFSHDYPYAKVLKGRSNYPTQLFPQRFASRGFDQVSAADCTKKQGDPESCKWCEHTGLCPYEQAKREALSAWLAVVNTSYFLTEANQVGRFSKQGLVIADEADLLERELMGFVSVEISEKRAARYGLQPPEKVTVAESWKLWLDDAIPLLRAELSRLPIATEDIQVLREAKYLTGVIDKLHLIRKGLDEDHSWVYTGHGNNISFKPSRVDDIGKAYLWSHSEKWLLMSATVISAEEMLDSLGYTGEYRVVTCPNTFPIENRKVKVQGAGNMAKKSYETDMPKVAKAVLGIVQEHNDDRILIHTVSYQLMKDLYDELAKAVSSRPVLSYGSAFERKRALDNFKARDRAILIAPSMDRGVDLPDDLCRVQVIAKVPFPYLGDRQVSARLHSRGGQAWYNVQACRTLVQMCGRAVRSQTDWAVTYIIDSAFQSVLWSRSRGLLPRWFVEAIEWR